MNKNPLLVTADSIANVSTKVIINNGMILKKQKSELIFKPTFLNGYNTLI